MDSPGKGRARGRVAAAMALLAAVSALVLYWRYWQAPASVQAFVNTGILYVRAPIPGEIALEPGLQPGAQLVAGQLIGRIVSDVENPRIFQLRIQQESLAVRRAELAEHLRGIERRVTARRELATLFRSEADEQAALQRTHAQAQLATVRAELAQARAAATSAASTRTRLDELRRHGGISQAAYEEADSTATQAEARVDALRAKLAQAQAGLRAASSGLQLDGPRTLSYPHIRLRQLEVELLDLEQEREQTRQILSGLAQELDRVAFELEKQSEALIRSPIAGVVWSLDAKSGEKLDSAASIVQLVNCSDVWVDAFFKEAPAAALRPGAPVTVVTLNGKRRWTGAIETLRGGTGRVTIGQYVAQPPPEVAQRQIPVRVVTARVSVDWEEGLEPESFCQAGRSVKVTARR